MRRNRRIHHTAFRDGLLVAYDQAGRELARGKDGLEIVAIPEDRDPAICHSKSRVSGVYCNPDGTWRCQTRTGRIEITNVTQGEAEAYALTKKGKGTHT